LVGIVGFATLLTVGNQISKMDTKFHSSAAFDQLSDVEIKNEAKIKKIFLKISLDHFSKNVFFFMEQNVK